MIDVSPAQKQTLKRLRDKAVQAQTDEHNGEPHDPNAIRNLESYANEIGVAVLWHGINPLFQKNNNTDFLED